MNGGHRWPEEAHLRIGILTDSIGALNSKTKIYVTTAVRELVRSLLNVDLIFHEKFPGGDLPEAANFFDRGGSDKRCDVYLIVMMSNYAATTSSQHGIGEDIVQACLRLQKVAESVPIYIVYGGPGDMWELVRSQGMQGVERFHAKTSSIRELLGRSGRIRLNSGISDFRASFSREDLDYLGHIKGVAREKAITWFSWLIRKVSDHIFQTQKMEKVQDSPSKMQHGSQCADSCQGTSPTASPHSLPATVVRKFEMHGLDPMYTLPGPLHERDCVRTLSDEKPNVFLLAGPDERCARHQEAACEMFTKLGWDPRLIWGIPSWLKVEHPRSHWAWVLALLPRVWYMIQASKNCTDGDVVLIGEDSCWPTHMCTPKVVRDLMEEAASKGFSGIWLGAAGSMKERTFDVTVDSRGLRVNQPCAVSEAPRGSKLFAVQVCELRVMLQAWGWVPSGWYVDGVNQLLAASGHLWVPKKFLAASMPHFSMRTRRYCDGQGQLNLEGERLKLEEDFKLEEACCAAAYSQE